MFEGWRVLPGTAANWKQLFSINFSYVLHCSHKQHPQATKHLPKLGHTKPISLFYADITFCAAQIENVYGFGFLLSNYYKFGFISGNYNNIKKKKPEIRIDFIWSEPIPELQILLAPDFFSVIMFSQVWGNFVSKLGFASYLFTVVCSLRHQSAIWCHIHIHILHKGEVSMND